jgi:hypothetical protein
MKINVGKADSIARVVMAIAIFGAGFYFKSYWGLLGIVPLVTGLSRRCPVYLPFHITTCAKEEAK